MGLTEAIHAIIDERTNAIVSVVGKRYTKAELQPKKLWKYAAVIKDLGMTKEEQKGMWRVENL
ncbi:hypothetical protein [Siminovitchia sp. 179-K 8D1 HS]|uniref:hypothetical protein n=1 Tax=Siminovitchia sp. 179-K 8D1 HS TaxID=3142385 RepID=UPI0039A2CF41